MDRYEWFSALLTLVADNYDVKDACMRNCMGEIEINGEYAGKKITIRATVEEDAKDGN